MTITATADLLTDDIRKIYAVARVPWRGAWLTGRWRLQLAALELGHSFSERRGRRKQRQVQAGGARVDRDRLPRGNPRVRFAIGLALFAMVVGRTD